MKKDIYYANRAGCSRTLIYYFALTGLNNYFVSKPRAHALGYRYFATSWLITTFKIISNRFFRLLAANYLLLAFAVLIVPAQTTPDQKKIGAGMDRIAEKAAHQAELAELRARAQHLFEAGEFASARELLLTTDEETFYQPELHSYFLEISRQINVMKNSLTPFDSSFAIDSNNRVQSFINYFQGRGNAKVRTAFARLAQYEAMMRKTFQKEHVPEELIYVGLVESAYNPYARSAAGAAGIWQFISDTGKRYGLRSNGSFDERNDPQKSTRAAAIYLRDLYAIFGDWPLALAAYNAGEHRILKVIEKTGVRDFWQISRRGLLPQETIDYVPAVLAAIAIGKDHKGLFINTERKK